MLYGIAAVMLGIAAILYGTAALCKALGVHVKEPEHELTPEEKNALEASAKASEAYTQALADLVAFTGGTAGGDKIL